MLQLYASTCTGHNGTVVHLYFVKEAIKKKKYKQDLEMQFFFSLCAKSGGKKGRVKLLTSVYVMSRCVVVM